MKKETKQKLYCSYTQERETIHDDLGNDGPYTGSYEYHYDSELVGVSRKQPKTTKYELVEIKDSESLPEVVYVVVVKYSTGDTFGHSSGHIHFEGIYRDFDTAELTKDEIQSNEYETKNYCPWLGYFERLEDVFVETRNLE